jgi:flagellar basal-body rod protein FlgC
MNVIAENLANLETTRTPQGGPYRAKRVVFASRPFEGSFGDVLRSELDAKANLVEVAGIIEDNSQPRLVYDPQHPDADSKGYVAMPNISVIHEMVDMLMATRAYEANVTAMNASKRMALKALEIGR